VARGCITPDHVLRTKPAALWVADPPYADGRALRARLDAEVARYAREYDAYFEAMCRDKGVTRRKLDPWPRVVLLPGYGACAIGATAREADIALDVYEHTAAVMLAAADVGSYTPCSRADLFDVEYWSLEQAKLGTAKEAPLTGQVAAITGAAGGIGAATARAFAAAGAEVALLDIDETAARTAAKAIGGAALGLACDVTDVASVRAAFARIAETFGGVDIVVSNAGAAWQGRIGDVDEAVLRKSFELNFYGHQRVAQAAVAIMRAQGTGGCLLFNASKQAVNPGPDFGPYGLPKAATLFLARQYAVDHGAEGIRANAVNADRIRSGLLTGAMIAERARARGVSEAAYMSGNLLGREVTAEDVAQAFLAQALALKTTGGLTTVDGGNIAAAPR
jgi:NAD(P)-dependent dehydrogenase (short-subunit alcohol dehydrogenase family)